MGKYKVEHEFDPFELAGVEPPKSKAKQREILQNVADYLKPAIENYCDDMNSPVSGHGRFKNLTKKYANEKADAGGIPIPNLLLDGDMRSALVAKPTRQGTVKVEVVGKESDKADGHCNHSGNSRIPTRRFIPDEGEQFKRAILLDVKAIVQEGMGDDE